MMGLGSTADVSLAEARDKAADMRTLVRDGVESDGTTPRGRSGTREDVPPVGGSVYRRLRVRLGSRALGAMAVFAHELCLRSHRRVAALRDRDTVNARALEFAILTAARPGEVRFARWDEIDPDLVVWTIPAPRMKARRQHKVPLSKPARAILSDLAQVKTVAA